MKKLALLVVLLIPVTLFSQDSLNLEVLSPAEYAQRISGKVILVDVRTAEEFEKGHIPKAQNVDFFAKDFVKQFEKFDKNKPIYLYCRSGNRSAKAARILEKKGFTEIIDLQGGYKAWTTFHGQPFEEN